MLVVAVFSVFVWESRQYKGIIERLSCVLEI